MSQKKRKKKKKSAIAWNRYKLNEKKKTKKQSKQKTDCNYDSTCLQWHDKQVGCISVLPDWWQILWLCSFVWAYWCSET